MEMEKNEHKSESGEGNTMFHWPVCRGDMEEVNEPKSDSREGNTEFHWAVCKGDKKLVMEMLNRYNKEEITKDLTTYATGRKFAQTVMLGELPLFTSALSFNRDMLDILLNAGANLYATNTKGDNICHALIQYAGMYPDKESDVIDMLDYISNEKEDETCDIPLCKMKNEKQFTPLELSIQYGLSKSFLAIYNTKHYKKQIDACLIDIKRYDITVLEPIVQDDPFCKSRVCFHDGRTIDTEKAEQNNAQRKSKDNTTNEQNTTADREKDQVASQSILYLLFDIPPSDALSFLLAPMVKRLIKLKWEYYKWFIWLWCFLHFIFVCFLTWYATSRAVQQSNTFTGTFDVSVSPTYMRRVFEDKMLTGFAVFSLIWGMVFLIPEVAKWIKLGCPCCRQTFEWNKIIKLNPYSNVSLRLLLSLFSLSLILDFWLTLINHYGSSFQYDNFCLYVSVIIGWLFLIFLMRAFKYFSFFGVILHKVMLGDVIRFVVIFTLNVFGFGTAMFMALQGSGAIDDENYSTYRRTLLSMVKLIGGLGDVPNFYETRYPEICIVIFFVYEIMTVVVILNALIALMSATCTELVGNVRNDHPHDRYWQLDLLALILYLEGFFPECLTRRVGEEIDGKRILTIRSLVSRFEHELDRDNKNKKEDRKPEDKKLGTEKVHPVKANSRPNTDNRRIDVYHIKRCDRCLYES
ncbi:transient receptor potential cation channel subfamily V member 3-like [Mya arenaria]|uniref:transient receptor potential cation channel subfamily V member 3-like n=1 Tax=Mya arenaria TaxID=6604 RepID=UPI0022DFBED9|nr:transient receptor potential cation channel subfamily V member 3-like [Mya arenaria]